MSPSLPVIFHNRQGVKLQILHSGAIRLCVDGEKVCVCVLRGIEGGLRLFPLLLTRTKAASRNVLVKVRFCRCQLFGRKGGSKTAMLSGTSPKSASQMQSFKLIVYLFILAQSENVDTAICPWVKIIIIIKQVRKQFAFKINQQLPPIYCS